MAWKPTNFPGVRYREHESRKHGIQKDRYFSIRYKLAGRDREEGFGWASQGFTAAKAYELRNELKANHKAGTGPQTLAEKRELEDLTRQEENNRKIQIEKDKVNLNQFWEGTYFPFSQQNKKENTYRTEKTLFKNWISPAIGNKDFRTLAPIHFEKLKSNMLKAKKSPATIKHAFNVVLQIWNLARRDGYVHADCPARQIKLPKINNKRHRFFTEQEAESLLAELKERSFQVYAYTLLSIHCGLRASEIFNLTWKDVNFESATLCIRDGKPGKDRYAFLTNQTRALLLNMKPDKCLPKDLVFKNKYGGAIKEPSRTFERVVQELGLNDGISSSKQRAVFHTCRHTCASWLVQRGVPLYLIGKMLGHSSHTMTERYSHLAPDSMKQAVEAMNQTLNPDQKGKVINLDQFKNN